MTNPIINITYPQQTIVYHILINAGVTVKVASLIIMFL
jgi:hypothetical protein